MRLRLKGRAVFVSHVGLTSLALMTLLPNTSAASMRGHHAAHAVGVAPTEALSSQRNASRAGQITEYSLPNSLFGELWSITLGPDGALWFTVFQGNMVGRITTTGKATIYKTPTQQSVPWGITAGPDGALWFTESGIGSIGRITTSGRITEYSLQSGDLPLGITAGPDGALWFLMAPYVGRITLSGQHSLFPAATGHGIVTGPDGALWFSNTNYNTPGGGISRMTTGGMITRYPVPGAAVQFLAVGPDQRIWFTQGDGCRVAAVGSITTSGLLKLYQAVPCSEPNGIAAGPDGALWFTELHGGHVDRITTSGKMTRYKVPTAHAAPRSIAAGPDGAMWFVEASSTAHKIGRITTGSP